MIHKGVCDKGSIWNPSNCECECDKSCDVGEYLDYENCKCTKQLVDKLVEECTENIDEVKITGMALFEHENECVWSYTICVTNTSCALKKVLIIKQHFLIKLLKWLQILKA